MRAAAGGGADQGDGGIVLGRDDIEEALDKDRPQPRLRQGRAPGHRRMARRQGPVIGQIDHFWCSLSLAARRLAA